MRKYFLFLVVGFFFLSFPSFSFAQSSLTCPRIMIPAYFYPGAIWDQAIAGYPAVDSMIANPNSGPGSQKDNNYVIYINKAKNAGIRILGYVHTSYGNRSSVVVKQEIDAYRNFYDVKDIFLDEMSADKTQIPYYKDVVAYIKSKGGNFVVLNPGTMPQQEYFSENVGDNIMIFENSYVSFTSFTAPSWILSYPSSKITYLVYQTPTSANMETVLQKARQNNAGYIYITHDVLPNPWDTLPPYWTQLTDTIKSCLSQITPSPTPLPTNTPTPSCSLKNSGDANCDNKVDLLDFNVWRNEFLHSLQTKTADFNADTKVDLLDFNVWRGFFITRI